MIGFYIMTGVSLILLIILITVYMQNTNLKQEKTKYIDDNRKLLQRMQKLDGELNDTKRSRENLYSQYEDLRDRYEEVNRTAFTDKLTELPNYEQFTDLLEGVTSTLRENERCALAVVRLANYDRTTNAGGHASGDELILDFSARIRSNLTEDDFAARISDDEFAIISQNFDSRGEYEERISKLYRILSLPFESGSREVIPQIYMAATLAPEDGKTSQLLSLNVRLALSHAIYGTQKKIYYYESRMAEETIRKMELTALLNNTVNENSFHYLLGAQINLRDKMPVAFELIPVVENGRYGRLYPADYLKYTEDSGIGKKLFPLLFEEACRMQKSFSEAGYKNLSFIIPCYMGLVIDDDFVKKIYAAVEESDVDPTKLYIAISESTYRDSGNGLAACIRKTDKLGIHYLLDNFGENASSLKALVGTPVSLIKLSGRLLENINIDPERFLSSFINFVHNCNVKVIACDVELAEQETMLRQAKADYAQGELYNGYMAEEMAKQFLRLSGKQ